MCKRGKLNGNNKARRDTTVSEAQRAYSTKTTPSKSKRNSVRHANVHWEIQSAEKDRVSRITTSLKVKPPGGADSLAEKPRELQQYHNLLFPLAQQHHQCHLSCTLQRAWYKSPPEVPDKEADVSWDSRAQASRKAHRPIISDSCS